MTSAGFEPASTRLGNRRPSNWTTRPLAVALVLTCSAAWADPPADAPTSVHLEAGQPAPAAGRWLSDAEHIASEKVCADDSAFRKAAMSDESLRLSPLAVVAIVAGALAVGAATGVAVAVAAKR